MGKKMFNFNEKKEKIKKPTLELKPALNKEGLRVGTKSDGKTYSVRDDRSRYFFPDEWIKFCDGLTKLKAPIFNVLINTGARIEEALNIKPNDFDYDRNTLTLRVTKIKAKKKETVGKKRTFVVSLKFIKQMKKYISKKNLGPNDYLFPHKKDPTKPQTTQAAWRLMKRVLIKQGFKDYYNFSLHNIRKTHGNYLKALGVDSAEICDRLGHDMNTYLEHYSSATIFNRADKMMMIKILGNIYGFQ